MEREIYCDQLGCGRRRSRWLAVVSAIHSVPRLAADVRMCDLAAFALILVERQCLFDGRDVPPIFRFDDPVSVRDKRINQVREAILDKLSL